MAGGQERILRRRIAATESTKKITRAMELIAATRVVQAQERTRKARPYAEQITSVILDLAGAGATTNHPLLAEREEGGKAAVVVVTSDRGLAGAYNSAVIRAAEREIQAARTEGLDYSLFVVGKKALTYFRFRGYKIDHVFLGKTDRPTYEDAREIGEDNPLAIGADRSLQAGGVGGVQPGQDIAQRAGRRLAGRVEIELQRAAVLKREFQLGQLGPQAEASAVVQLGQIQPGEELHDVLPVDLAGGDVDAAQA